MPTQQEAIDDISEQFHIAWLAEAPAVAGGEAPEVRFWGLESALEPPADAPWVRLAVRHVAGFQGSLGGAGARRFERRGIVTAQIFAPLSSGQALPLGVRLATIAKNAYEGKSTPRGVWFRNVVVREIGPDRSWFQVNMSADFIYDEVK